MTSSEAAKNDDEGMQDFSAFNLDARLTRVLEKTNISKPTLIQEKAIALALEGKDILAKAKTGSGKTLAYLLPILQRLLQLSESSNYAGGIKVLVLVPTKELARQVTESCQGLMHYFPKTLTSLNLAGEESPHLQKTMLGAKPAIVIATPSRILSHLESGGVSLESSLEFLVIDEADLVLSFGYAQDVTTLAQKYLPKTAQTFLMSATLTTEMEELKQLVLRNPVILKLEEGSDDSEGKLHQFYIRCKEEDKFLLMYVTLKLKLLKGKILIFANDVERCFKLKLFLEQFGIKTCILNPELPAASRHHIVEEFNRGVYDIIIAGDTQSTSNTSSAAKPIAKRSKVKSDKEGGVSRGVDFKRVDVVLNLDFPLHTDTYVHRVGRTARGGESGTAISFVSTAEDEQMLTVISADQVARGNIINEHAFDLSQIDGFRYRCQDAYRAVTKNAIKTARLAAIKEEIIKSEKLKTFFEERPKDLQLLRHDYNSGVVKSRPHLKHVPEYLLATDQNSDANGTSKIETLPQVERDSNRPQTKTKKHFMKNNRNRKGGKDPLRNIKRK